jgi:hypothetical protein
MRCGRWVSIGFVTLVATVLSFGICGVAVAKVHKVHKEHLHARSSTYGSRAQLVPEQPVRRGPMRYYGGPKSPMWRGPVEN